MGGTSGPTTLKGPLGKMLEDDNILSGDIVNFQKIPGKLDFDVAPNLIFHNNDQLQFAALVLAMQEGSSGFEGQLGKYALQKAGPLHQARWLTLANRCMKLYATMSHPPDDLKRVVEFIVTVFAPAWFQSVKNPSIVDSPKVFFTLIKALKTFKFDVDQDDQQNDADPFKFLLAESKIPKGYMQIDMPDGWGDIQESEEMKIAVNNSAYNGHPESVILAMLCDERISFREQGVNIIEQIRALKSQSGGGPDQGLQIREFQPPVIDWDEIKDDYR